MQKMLDMFHCGAACKNINQLKSFTVLSLIDRVSLHACSCTTQITVGGIIMLTNSDSESPEDLIEPLKGKSINQL